MNLVIGCICVCVCVCVHIPPQCFQSQNHFFSFTSSVSLSTTHELTVCRHFTETCTSARTEAASDVSPSKPPETWSRYVTSSASVLVQLKDNLLKGN